MKALLSKCRRAYHEIRAVQDCPEAFPNVGDTDGYIELVLEALQHEARQLGCVTPHLGPDPSVGDALNVIAEIIQWCEEQADNSEFLSVPQAAKLLGLAERTIYQMVRDGRLTAYGKPKRIRRSDLLAEQQKPSEPEQQPRVRLKHLRHP